MPLSGLVDEIVALSRNGRTTPVLVTPKYLSLRNEFIVELSRELVSRIEPRGRFRIDWLCNTSLFRQRIARLRATRINLAIARQPSLRDRASIVVSGSIGRCESSTDMLILGLCNVHQDLPSWVQKIQLSSLVRHPPLQVI